MKYSKILIPLILTTNLALATVYENGENGISKWKISDNKPFGAIIQSKYDNEKRTKVISFRGKGRANAYMLGDKRGTDAWANRSEKILKWSMKFNEKFKIAVYVMTRKGKRVLFYDHRDYDKGFYKKRYIKIGLGSRSKNGKWIKIVRDLEADIKKYEPDNELLVVNAFKIKGSGEIDTIELTNDKIVPSFKISDVQATFVNKNYAKISWQLNQRGTGQVEYGTTIQYGNFSNKEESFRYTQHRQSLRGLREGTLYHYRVISEDRAGNRVVSKDYTFKTKGHIDGGEGCEVKYRNKVLHFADENNKQLSGNRLITIDYGNMKVLKKESIKGSLNHHADPMGTLTNAHYMMMIPKGSNYITVRSIKSGRFLKNIHLPFRPRSADAYNKTHNLVLLNSRDRPAGVLIDAKTAKIVGKAGFNIKCTQNGAGIIPPYNVYSPFENFSPSFRCTNVDFGGDQISGHPLWISSESFVLIDRANRLLHVYKIRKYGQQWRTSLVQTLQTNSSLHQLIPEDATSPNNKIFYGMTEGNKAKGIVAHVYKYILRGSKLYQLASTKLRVNNVYGVQGHNLYITPDKRYLYAPVGSRIIGFVNKRPIKGAVFVVDTRTMRVVKQIQTGKGAGHVAFSKQKGIAIVTNHTDTYLTAINYRTHRFIRNIPLNFPRKNIFNLTQSHMQHVSPDGKYYYNFWTDGGIFFRVNLSTLRVDSKLYTGGIPIQGNFYENIATNCNIPALPDDDGYNDVFGRPPLLRRAVPMAQNADEVKNDGAVKAKVPVYIKKDSDEVAKDSNGYTK